MQLVISLSEAPLRPCDDMHMYDDEAYHKFPGSNWVYNKLVLSEKLEYHCGPAGTKVGKDGEYIVRPITNLSGMGAGATIVHCKKNKVPTNEPGYFWCEVFEGDHITADFIFRKGERYNTFVAQGWNNKKDLVRFSRWQKLDKLPEECMIPTWLEGALSPNQCNVEWVGGKIIEVHLRHGNADFPENATEVIPMWEGDDVQAHSTWLEGGYTFIPNEDDADGNISPKRIGFYYK